MDSTAITQDELKALSSLLGVRETRGEFRGRPVMTIGVLATLYFKKPYFRPAREAVAEVFDDYVRDFKSHLRWIQKSGTDLQEMHPFGSEPLPSQWLPNHPDNQDWSVAAHSGEMARDVADFQISAFGGENYGEVSKDKLGHIQIHLPLLWLNEHPGDLQSRVLRAAKRLKPFFGYAGIGFLLPEDISAAIRGQVLVAPIASRYPGIEVDEPLVSAGYCQHGIKGVNWLTVLSDHFVQEAGGLDYLRVRLDEPTFPFFEYEGGVMIQAGTRPEIGDSQQNRWPRHYVTLAKVLKRIQIRTHGPFSFGGVGRTDKAASEAWLFRFDGK